MRLSVYIIAFNEVDKIEDCIKSVLWADEIILVDSHSTDGTTEIAEKYNLQIKHVTFCGYGKLRNQAISFCKNEWILSIDSDERCTDQVEDEIKSLIDNPLHDIYKIPRRNFFMGKWIKHSGWYPNYRQPQLFRKDCMRYDEKPVHEGFINISKKPIGILKNSIWQVPFKNYSEMIHKANRYSSLGVEKLESKGLKGGILQAILHGLWSFIKHYFFKLGLLDGKAGFIIAFANFEGTYYRYLKLMEKNSKWKSP